MCRVFFLPQISYINVFIFSYSCPMHYNSLLYPNITIIWTEGEVFLKSSLCSLFWASEVLTDWQTITLELGLFCTLNFFFFTCFNSLRIYSNVLRSYILPFPIHLWTTLSFFTTCATVSLLAFVVGIVNLSSPIYSVHICLYVQLSTWA